MNQGRTGPVPFCVSSNCGLYLTELTLFKYWVKNRDELSLVKWKTTSKCCCWVFYIVKGMLSLLHSCHEVTRKLAHKCLLKQYIGKSILPHSFIYQGSHLGKTSVNLFLCEKYVWLSSLMMTSIYQVFKQFSQYSIYNS